MSRGDSISKDFEVFFMEHDIGSTSQDIGLAECAIQIVVVMPKRMLKAQSSKAQEIALGQSGVKCSLYLKPISDKGLALHTCLHSEALLL